MFKVRLGGHLQRGVKIDWGLQGSSGSAGEILLSRLGDFTKVYLLCECSLSWTLEIYTMTGKSFSFICSFNKCWDLRFLNESKALKRLPQMPLRRSLRLDFGVQIEHLGEAPYLLILHMAFLCRIRLSHHQILVHGSHSFLLHLLAKK